MSTKLEQNHIPHCPKCNYMLDAFTGISGNNIPAEGDVSICMGCIATLVFTIVDGDIHLRIPTEQEALIFDADPDIIRVKKAIYEADIKSKLSYPKKK